MAPPRKRNGTKHRQQQSLNAAMSQLNEDDASLIKQEILKCLTSEAFTNAIITAIHPITEKLSTELERALLKIQEQENDIAELKRTVALQDEKLCQLQRTSMEDRKTAVNHEENCELRVIGLPTDIDDATGKIVDAVKERMGIDIKDSISIRIDRFSESRTALQDTASTMTDAPAQTRKAMRIRFQQDQLKDQVYANRVKLKGTDIYLSECLSREKQKLFYQCRQLRKKSKIKATWTTNENIFIRTLDNELCQVFSEADLDLYFSPPEKA